MENWGAIIYTEANLLTAASLFALSLTAGAALAAGEPDPARNNPGPSSAPQQKSTKDSKKKKEKKSEQEFRDGYRAAYAMVQAGKYAEAFAAFKALDEDDHPDVANYLGYTAASSATTMSPRSGTSGRLPPTRSTCAPGSITACGMSSRATAQGRRLPGKDRGDLRQQELQGVPGPQGRHGRDCDVLSRVPRACRWRSAGRPRSTPAALRASFRPPLRLLHHPAEIARLATLDRQHQDRRRRVGMHAPSRRRAPPRPMTRGS